ncbi:MAG: sigma-70 family RNA polymerase sigma factor [Pseudomonadota bacterium]
MTSLDTLSDEALIKRWRAHPEQGDACLEQLFRNSYPRVAAWCRRFCRDPEQAADVVQEVFVKVQDKLAAYRGESRFSTWLYSVTRRVAIDHGLAQARQPQAEDAAKAPDPIDPDLHTEELTAREQVLERLRAAMQSDLAPEEAKVVYLHYVDGMSLPAITRQLALTNRSGAKASLVSGMRKLRKRFGPWLARELGVEPGSPA